MAEVEVMVSYRVVVRVESSMPMVAAALKAGDRLPRGAYDVKVEALHCPPVTACPTRVRHAR